MKTITTYHGRTIEKYNKNHFYKKGDCVLYKTLLYEYVYDTPQYTYNAPFNISPDISFSPIDGRLVWKPIGFISDLIMKQEEECEESGGNHIGNIKADNAVVYGNNTGNIIANGEKSVVVVFGDVIGNIEADQIIHVHDVDKMKIKEALAHVKDRRF